MPVALSSLELSSLYCSFVCHRVIVPVSQLPKVPSIFPLAARVWQNVSLDLLIPSRVRIVLEEISQVNIKNAYDKHGSEKEYSKTSVAKAFDPSHLG